MVDSANNMMITPKIRGYQLSWDHARIVWFCCMLCLQTHYACLQDIDNVSWVTANIDLCELTRKLYLSVVPELIYRPLFRCSKTTDIFLWQTQVTVCALFLLFFKSVYWLLLVLTLAVACMFHSTVVFPGFLIRHRGRLIYWCKHIPSGLFHFGWIILLHDECLKWFALNTAPRSVRISLDSADNS